MYLPVATTYYYPTLLFSAEDNDRIADIGSDIIAYNEEKRLPECMEKVAGFIASHSEPIEVLIVENGSSDRTLEMAREYAEKSPGWLKVLHEDTPGKGNAVVRVELSEDPAAVTITFIDHGIPYDPTAKEDPDVTLSAEEREIGGLGIYMTKKTMDEVRYEYKDGQNRLTLIKQL